MKFGQKQTISQKAKMVEDRYGKTTGASKGRTVKPKIKVTPSGTRPTKKQVGIKIKGTW
jgi:hypothetical protein